MDSITLFAHIVRYVGSNICSRAHVELQALGVLPKCNLQSQTLLQQDDADLRAAFALWCGLCIDPTHDMSSKRFFQMIASGRAKAPTSSEGENFIEALAEILRTDKVLTVRSIDFGRAFVTPDGLNASATIFHTDGTARQYITGQPLNRPHESVELDDLKLLAIHRDLRATPRVWPDDAIPQTAKLDFIGGLIQIEHHGSKDTIRRGQASTAR